MTNLSDGVTDAAPAEAAPAEDTGVAVADQPVVSEAPSEPEPAAEAEAPEREYLEVDEVADRYVRVKVDGEDVEVPLSEALQGYSRTEDYTRKRQADADNLRLAQNLRQHPGATLQMLAAEQGLTVAEYLNQGGVPGVPSAPQQAQPEERPPEDPVERQLWEMNRTVRELQEREERRVADAQLNAAVNGLKQQYGATDDQIKETVQAAFMMGQQTGRPVGPEMLPLVYTSLQFTKAQGVQQGTQEHQAQQQAQTQARQAQAAQASETVATGASAAGTTEAPVAGQPMTAEEAIRAALAQHGTP